jgi:alginate O-acetyltransferase complex protein AlgI
MVFHTLLYIYLFLPVTLFLYYISRKSLRNIILLLASLVFSAWFQVSLAAVLIGSIALNYVAGLAIGRANDEKWRRLLFTMAVTANLALLGVYKYFSFLGATVSELISMAGFDPFIVAEFAMPIGISFYTFKALTYLISVKRREVPAQKNFIDLALYVALFPQLVAGPIDRYASLAPQLANPSPSIDRFASGIRQFILGLAKKVLIATPLALAADKIFDSPVAMLNAPVAWLGAILYMLQIYYDFAGYTDMAIGTGKMFGLQFAENFNFPYNARSVRDFWKRWHISLSTWLRDYLFLPLAYARSKKMVKEKYLHLKTDKWIYLYATLVTFVLCGLWHGAAWTFILWGFLHGIMMVIEQFGFGRILKKAFKPLQHVYLLIFIALSWVLFRSPSVRDAFQFMGAMFGTGGQSENLWLAAEYLDIRTTLVLIIGVLGSTRFFEYLANAFKSLTQSKIPVIRVAGTHAWYISGILFAMLAMALSMVYIIAETSMPFIYFKF